MNDLTMPWVIVIGYAVGALALWVRGKIVEAGAPGGRAMSIIATFFFVVTTVFWLSFGFTRWGLVAGIAAVAAVVTGIVYLRQHGSGEPTFGVFPAMGQTWSLRGPAPERPPRFTEFGHQGHQVLSYEYAVSDGTYTMTELRIPPVPALSIVPRFAMLGGTPEGFPVTGSFVSHPAFGTPAVPGTNPVPVDPEFDKWYQVSTSDPGFAAAVLTPEIRALLMESGPLFHARAFAFDQGALWTVDAGGMSGDRTNRGSRALAVFAAAVAPAIWRGTAFGAVAANAQTSVEAWRASGGGSVLSWINARRELANRKPLTGLSMVVRSAIAVALLVFCAMPTFNLATAIAGQADTVPLTVTKVRNYTNGCYDRHGKRQLVCSNAEHTTVTGTYTAGGVQHQLEIPNPDGQPKVGDTIPLKVGSMWWYPVFRPGIDGWVQSSLCVPGLLLGVWLAKATYLPRRPRKERKPEPQAQVAPPLH